MGGTGNWFDEDRRKNVKESLVQWYGNSSMDWTQQFEEYILEPRKRVGCGTFSAEEESAFYDMMRSMLVFEPGERATIEDVVACEWMREWGMPVVQRMWEVQKGS